MDCQQLIVYGLLLLVGLMVLKETCYPEPEGLENAPDNKGLNMPAKVESVPESQPMVVAASEENIAYDEMPMRVQGIKTSTTSCYPQNTLKPEDLLPESEKDKIQQFDKDQPTGEGILKGVNFLDAGFHVGVNTVGQSLRNANLNLRAEPPNPRVQVSPWLNTTIGPDLSRLPLGETDVCGK
jgi:hypothetical protein